MAHPQHLVLIDKAVEDDYPGWLTGCWKSGVVCTTIRTTRDALAAVQGARAPLKSVNFIFHGNFTDTQITFLDTTITVSPYSEIESAIRAGRSSTKYGGYWKVRDLLRSITRNSTSPEVYVYACSLARAPGFADVFKRAQQAGYIICGSTNTTGRIESWKQALENVRYAWSEVDPAYKATKAFWLRDPLGTYGLPRRWIADYTVRLNRTMLTPPPSETTLLAIGIPRWIGRRIAAYVDMDWNIEWSNAPGGPTGAQVTHAADELFSTIPV